MDNHLQIAIASIQCFTDDGTLDIGELNYLLGMATADNVITENEKEVLASIFKRVAKKDVTTTVWDRIAEIKEKYSI